MTKKIKLPKAKIYQITTAILAIILVGVFVFKPFGCTGAMIGLGDKDTVAESTVNYLNDNFGTDAKLIGTEEMNGMYKFALEIQGEETEVYVSPDGNVIFPIAIDVTSEMIEQQPQQPQDIPKTGTPEVQLFVMSHCPYGTQIEKGIIPVVELLGD